MVVTEEIVQYLPALLRGAGLTLVLVVVSSIAGSLLGVLMSIARTSPLPPARWLSAVYINFLRGQPVLIILLFTYYALPLIFPAATFSRGFTAIVGLSVYAGAYIAEIFRGSIEAIPRGQTEAAEALGMHYVTRMRYVILPQATKIAVPSWIGFLISLVKASALVSVIGFVELTRAGTIISSATFEPLTVFLVVAGIYFVLSYPLSLLGRWYERRLA